MVAAHSVVYSELTFSSAKVHLKQRCILDLLGLKISSYPGVVSTIVQLEILPIKLPYDLRECRNRHSL